MQQLGEKLGDAADARREAASASSRPGGDGGSDDGVCEHGTSTTTSGDASDPQSSGADNVRARAARGARR